MTNQELAGIWKSKSHIIRTTAQSLGQCGERTRLMGKVETLIECAKELEELVPAKEYHAGLDEALNTGDGMYKP